MFSLFLHFAQKVLQANSTDPDQTPRFAASELSLHCLHLSPKRVYDLKRVNVTFRQVYLYICACRLLMANLFLLYFFTEFNVLALDYTERKRVFL